MSALWNELAHLLAKGGPLMAPLLALAVALFATAFRLGASLRSAARLGLPPGPGAATTPPAPRSATGQAQALAARRLAWHLHLERRLRFLRIMTGAAPLLGLLGTVTGMLKTFRGLSARHAADTMDLVAKGISEALVTTETGLTIGIVGLLMVYLLREYRDRLLEEFGRRENGLLLDAAKEAPC